MKASDWCTRLDYPGKWAYSGEDVTDASYRVVPKWAAMSAMIAVWNDPWSAKTTESMLVLAWWEPILRLLVHTELPIDLSARALCIGVPGWQVEIVGAYDGIVGHWTAQYGVSGRGFPHIGVKDTNAAGIAQWVDEQAFLQVAARD